MAIPELRAVGWALALIAIAGVARAASPGSVDTGDAPAAPSAAGALGPRVLVEPLHQAVLSAQIAGRIERLPYHAGDAFHRGDVLARFDCTIYRAKQAAARASLLQASDKLQNDRQLAELKSIGSLDVALDQAAQQRAKAELRVASALVDGCLIRAPYNGRVVARKVHEHESVSVGTPLLQVLDDTGFRLKVIIPSDWLGWVRKGTKFVVHIDDTGRDYPAHVTVIGAQVDPVSQSISVRARIDGSTRGLIAGMGGSADFSGARPHSATAQGTR